MYQNNIQKAARQSGLELKRMEKRREKADKLVEGFEALGLEARALRTCECGTFLEFAYTKSGATMTDANFCRDRLCPLCNYRRSMKIFAQASMVMDAIEAGERRYAFIFGSLTVKNVEAEDLSLMIDRLFAAWKSMQKRKDVKAVVKGYIRTLEVTYNSTRDDFHPHIHFVFAVNESYFQSRDYLSYERWREIWKEEMGLDYDPQIHVRRIKNEPKAVCEVSKYAASPDDYIDAVAGNPEKSLEVLQTFIISLKGRRLVVYGGVFRKIRAELKLQDVEFGDLTDNDIVRNDMAIAIERFRWIVGAGYASVDLEERK